MIRKSAYGVVGLALLASPILVTAQSAPLTDTCTATPTVECLQTEIQQLTTILNQLLAAHGQSSSSTASATSAAPAGVAGANGGTQSNPIPIDVFLIGGQSNAEGTVTNSNSVTSPSVPPGKALQFYNNTISDADDPVGNATNGSAWPSFGMTYYNETGRRILFVPSAVGGSCQTATAAELAHGYTASWDDTGPGSYLGGSVANAQNAIAQLTQAGYTPSFKGILWDQGECDASYISLAGIYGSDTVANYQAGLATMIANYRAQFGSGTPFYIFRTGTQVTSNVTGYDQVRQAQENVAASDSNTYIVFRDAVNFPAEGLMGPDGLHYNQAGYNEMGTNGAEGVVNAQTGNPSPTATLTANGEHALSITSGTNYTVAWSSTNASSCTLSWSRTDGITPTTGSQNVGTASGSAPSGLLGSYTLTCTNAAGTSVSDTDTISSDAQSSTPVCAMSFNPSSVLQSAPSTFAWVSANATYAVISPWSGQQSPNGSIVNAHSGQTILAQGTFYGPNGTATCNATLTVTNGSTTPPFISRTDTGDAVAGSTVNVTGTGFTSSNTILFNFTSVATAASSNGTTLSFTIPASQAVGSYQIAVQNQNGTSNVVGLTVYDTNSPTISGLNTGDAWPGETIVVSGTNLAGSDTVYIDGTSVGATTAVSATSLTFTIPSSFAVSTQTHAVTVSNSGGTSNPYPLRIDQTDANQSGAPTCTMSFNPSSVTQNAPSTLSWNSTNSTYATISPWNGQWSPNGSIFEAHSGQTIVAQGTFYGPNGTATCRATLTVINANQPTATLTVNGKHTLTITPGDPAYTVAWSSTNASSCTLSYSRTDGITPTTGSNNVGTASGSGLSGLLGSYTLTCTDATGQSVSDTDTITSTSAPTCTDSVSPTTASVGQNVTDTWSSSPGAASMSFTVTQNGTAVVGPGPSGVNGVYQTSWSAPGTYLYTRTVKDASGNTGTCSSSVTVQNATSASQNPNIANALTALESALAGLLRELGR